MNFEDITTMTYVDNTVIIDGVAMTIASKLDSGIAAVQYIAYLDKCIEEWSDGMKYVPLTKYEFALNEWEVAREAEIKRNEYSIDATEKTRKELAKLCDRKSKDTKTYIAGREITDEQVARYEEKYQTAIKYNEDGSNSDILKLEADLQFITINELVASIIAKGKVWREQLTSFNAKIEAFRVRVTKFIDIGELDKANDIINEYKLLKADASDDDIKRLFE